MRFRLTHFLRVGQGFTQDCRIISRSVRFWPCEQAIQYSASLRPQVRAKAPAEMG